ncbi:transcription factor IIA, alpha/beta subunit-domain-containing protein, partial [Cantharellus anzutake]|uniref:transcription factor IIA, alpha/beta subunit-domain-containing protein n=1 Tax=Cantharellus anzutake TaxID=1750568 RepID=UPI00190577A6
MSNKIVPGVYRHIVDDVMANIRSEFEEFGVDERVLTDLQARWESKILSSNVAEFERAPPQQPQPHLVYPSAPPSLPGPPLSTRYSHPNHLDSTQPPPLAAPPPSTLYPRLPSNGVGNPLGSGSPYGFNASLPPVKQEPQTQTLPRIPQLDGPSSSSQDSDGSSDEASPSPISKPVPLPSLKVEKKEEIDDEAVIGSDLDDSDDDDNLAGIGDDPVNGAKDIVFCTYDK